MEKVLCWLFLSESREVVDRTNVTPLKKTHFPCTSWYQLPITSSLRSDFVFTSPSPCCDFVWLEPLHVLYMPSHEQFFELSYVYHSCRAWKMLFPWSSSLSLDLTPSSSFSMWIPELCGEGFKDILFKTQCSQDSPSLNVVQSWFLC